MMVKFEWSTAEVDGMWVKRILVEHLAWTRWRMMVAAVLECYWEASAAVVVVAVAYWWWSIDE